MKGLIVATLAASLLGSVCAVAQSADRTTIAKIAGKKFYAADGSSLTFLAYKGGLAREIHTANGAVQIETYALSAGTVSDAEAGNDPSGTFQITDAGLAADYKDGRSELLAPSGAGSMRMMLRGTTGEVSCTAWYPEGHRFSDAERNAALIDVSANLALDESSTHNSCAPEPVREAHAHAHRRTAQSEETVVARLPD